MFPKASQKTAALAGAWTVFGLVPFEAWMERYKDSSVLASNLLWLAAVAIFLFVPGYLFVIGRENEPFDRTWFRDPQDRARYGVIGKRMFVWLVSVVAVGTVWSLLVSYMLFKGPTN